MRLLLTPIAVLLLLAGGTAPAVHAQQTAASYFHEAARQYVAGNRAAARRAVEQGLERNPSDPRLMALREKLREGGRPRSRQQSDSTSSQSRRQGQQNNPSSDRSSAGEEDPSPSDDGGRSQAGPRDEQAPESAGPGQESARERPSGERRPETDPSRRRGRGAPADTLSRAQAERLLRALEGQERQLLRRLRTRSADNRPVEKDW
jgi:hypothetical protein